eukprot:scaffold13222_cov122-Isochrysis_galbana.AAC.1
MMWRCGVVWVSGCWLSVSVCARPAAHAARRTGTGANAQLFERPPTLLCVCGADLRADVASLRYLTQYKTMALKLNPTRIKPRMRQAPPRGQKPQVERAVAPEEASPGLCRPALPCFWPQPHCASYWHTNTATT